MPKHIPGQESLIVVAEQSKQLVARDFNLPEDPNAGPSVNLIERNLRLQNVISYLAEIDMKHGFLSFDEPARRSYGERAQQVRANVENQLPRLKTAAKKEFAQATGFYAMIEAGVNPDRAKEDAQSDFSDFLKSFYGARHYTAAQAFRRKLAHNVEVLQGKEVTAPSVPEKPAKPASTSELESLERLERMRVIREDSRAGFFPATAQERTATLTYLDYLKNTAYPNGINNQFMEVFVHQQKHGHGWRAGKRALESIVYEMGDFLDNAMASHTALIDLERLVNECPNPHVTLADEVGAEHPAYAPLARFIDLKNAVEAGEASILDRAMRTRERRWAREGEGKHKAIEDQYTAKEPKETFTKRISKLAEALTVNVARRELADAISNEERRAAFWMTILKDVKRLPGGRRLLSSVVETAKAELAAYGKSA